MAVPIEWRVITLQKPGNPLYRRYWTGTGFNTTTLPNSAKKYGPHADPQTDWNHLRMEGQNPQLIKIIIDPKRGHATQPLA